MLGRATQVLLFLLCKVGLPIWGIIKRLEGFSKFMGSHECQYQHHKLLNKCLSVQPSYFSPSFFCLVLSHVSWCYCKTILTWCTTGGGKMASESMILNSSISGIKTPMNGLKF